MTNNKKNIKPYTKNAFPFKKARQGVLQYEGGGMMEEREPDFEIGFENNSSFDGYGHVSKGSAGITENKNIIRLTENELRKIVRNIITKLSKY